MQLISLRKGHENERAKQTKSTCFEAYVKQVFIQGNTNKMFVCTYLTKLDSFSFLIFHHHFRDIKIRALSWSANSIEYGQTARKCRLTWL